MDERNVRNHFIRACCLVCVRISAFVYAFNKSKICIMRRLFYGAKRKQLVKILLLDGNLKWPVRGKTQKRDEIVSQ